MKESANASPCVQSPTTVANNKKQEKQQQISRQVIHNNSPVADKGSAGCCLDISLFTIKSKLVSKKREHINVGQGLMFAWNLINLGMYMCIRYLVFNLLTLTLAQS